VSPPAPGDPAQAAVVIETPRPCGPSRGARRAAGSRGPRRPRRAVGGGQDHAGPGHRRGPRSARTGDQPHLRHRPGVPVADRWPAAGARRRLPARLGTRDRRPRPRRDARGVGDAGEWGQGGSRRWPRTGSSSPSTARGRR
jgi:hypothetical protein